MTSSTTKSKLLGDYGEKILAGGLCILPVILTIVLATLLITNSHTDLCHPDNYTCNTPKVIDGKPVESPQKPAAEHPNKSTNASPTNTSSPTFISDLQKAKADLERARTQSNSTNTNPAEHFAPLEIKNKYNCNEAQLVRGPQKASNSESKTYQIVGIVFMVILLLITTIIVGFWKNDLKTAPLITFLLNQDALIDKDKSQLKSVFTLGITSILVFIISIVFLAKKNIKGNHIVFSTNLTGILIAIACLIQLKADKKSTSLNVITIILGVVSVLIIIGTAILHTTETDNLNKGYLNTAINNTAMKIIPFFMGIVAIGNLLSIGYGIKTHQTGKAGLTFMITQGISVILLIAFIAFYYDYKSKCSSHSITTCKPVNKSTYDDEGNLVTSVSCDPITNMSISKTSVTNTSIAMIVLMSITQMVGLGAVIMS